MYPVSSGSFDKRLLIRDVFIIIFQSTSPASYSAKVTISDKRMQNNTNDFGGALNVNIN